MADSWLLFKPNIIITVHIRQQEGIPPNSFQPIANSRLSADKMMMMVLMMMMILTMSMNRALVCSQSFVSHPAPIIIK